MHIENPLKIKKKETAQGPKATRYGLSIVFSWCAKIISALKNLRAEKEEITTTPTYRTRHNLVYIHFHHSE